MEFMENGGTGDELMMLTDHANRKSIDQYTETTMSRKRMARAAARKRKDAKKRERYVQTEEKRLYQNSTNVIPFRPKAL